MSTIQKPEIEVRDVGPVEEFRYTLGQPGLHVLRGRPGSGKTTILRTVQLATDGRTDVKPTTRDGSSAAGKARVAGKSLVISRRVREEGELSVEGIGDLDIAGLHTPKFLDVAARDRHRIKALVRLGGVRPEASAFHELVGGQESFDAIVDPSATETDDLVEMGARVKRAFEREAQNQERYEEAKLADMRAQSAQTEGVTILADQAPPNEATIRAELAEAQQARAALVERARNADEVHRRAAEAEKRLAEAGGESVVREREDDLADARDLMQARADSVSRLEIQLSEAKAAHRLAMERVSDAERSLADAKRQDGLTAAWREEIAKGKSIPLVAPAEIEQASKRCSEIEERLAQAQRINRALEARDKARQLAEKAKGHGQAARRLRDAAGSVQDVLSDAVSKIAGCPLRVIVTTDGDPRLVLQTDRSGAELFDELSDGERWSVLLPLAAAQNRLIVLPQAAYGELSPETRAMLHTMAQNLGCYILTAQVDDGELRAEMWTADEVLRP